MGCKFPLNDKDTYIISRNPGSSTGSVKFYTGNLKDLVVNLKSGKGKNIFVDGGAEIVHELLKENLIDEYIISIIPVLLGDGISLFKNGRPESGLKFIDSRHFDKGLVQLHYMGVKNS